MTLADAWARDSLATLEQRSLKRALEPLSTPQGARVVIDGRELINFSSNDYLGLANDPDVIAAGREALERHGAGAGASRLVTGDSEAHRALERALAAFEGTEAALLFNSGYAANVGVLSALLGPGDAVFSDELNHASIVDGCRLSRAQVCIYRHRDVEHLEALLRATPARRRLVVTDSVFSMDGDRAPLRALREVCDRHGAALMLDEAHATGVLGATGRGLTELDGVEPDLKLATLSKALGGFGAFVACSSALRELLFNRARSLVFSTALPPAVCAMAQAALEKAKHPGLRARLWANIDRVAAALGQRPDSAIFSVVLGAPVAALTASARLREAGVLVKAIRPPTVPEGTSRLRIALSAAHRDDDVAALLRELRLSPQPSSVNESAGSTQHENR